VNRECPCGAEMTEVYFASHLYENRRAIEISWCSRCGNLFTKGLGELSEEQEWHHPLLRKVVS
jgi:hypothetical protein